jgi:hypothetical protein
LPEQEVKSLFSIGSAKPLKYFPNGLGKQMSDAIVTQMTQAIKESMYLGQQWGQALGPEVQNRVIERFKTEGVDLQASNPNNGMIMFR